MNLDDSQDRSIVYVSFTTSSWHFHGDLLLAAFATEEQAESTHNDDISKFLGNGMNANWTMTNISGGRSAVVITQYYH